MLPCTMPSILSRRELTTNLSLTGLALLASRPTQAQALGLYQHGVASGDPLLNRVIIWTRISPASDEQAIPVDWFISDEPSMSRILQ